MVSYDRYSHFRTNGEKNIVPFVNIEKKDTDYFEIYDRRKKRLDKISYDYYNDPNFGWLILQANPEYGSIEQEIPDGTILRIPYPLDITLNQYERGINKKIS